MSKHLSCGCCGEGFITWSGYKDQDQDRGYGICGSCQDDIEVRNEQEFDKAIAVLRDGLNDVNREKFIALDRERQKLLVWQALDDGMLTWNIRRA